MRRLRISIGKLAPTPQIVFAIGAYLVLGLLAIGFLATGNRYITAAGFAGIGIAVFTIRRFMPNPTAAKLDDRIAKTYPFKIPAVQTYPEYRIPPENDVRARVRFGCAPLLDCCFPLIVRKLSPLTWDHLAQSHAIDVEISIADFSKLFDAVRRPFADSSVDVVIASAASVERAQRGDIHNAVTTDAPIAVLPILQQFNAYYLFAKRREIKDFLVRTGYSSVENACTGTGSNSSLYAELNKVPVARTANLFLRIMEEFQVFAERGADLDAALVAFWTHLGGGKANPGRFINFDGPYSQPIQDSFEAFLTADGPSTFLGGIGQLSYLLNRSEVDGDFIVLAGPSDFSYQNVTSLVCSAALVKERANEIFRFIGWWFDVLNCFRRMYLFAEPDEYGGYREMKELICNGLYVNDVRLGLLPPGATEQDVDKALSFIKLRSAEEVGTFLLPNIHAALKISTALTDKLLKLDALVNLIPAAEEKNEPDTRSRRGAR